jgi:TRAP-type C4-dicarboxylate transport system substrate-binding protein
VALLTMFLVVPANATEHTIPVRVVTPFPIGHILADTANKLKERLELPDEGEDEPQFSATVGTSVLNEQTIDPQMTSCDPAARVGDIVITGGQPLQDWAPRYYFFNGPYVIRDFDHFQKVWNSHLGIEARLSIFANGNLVTLGTVYRGFRQFTSNKLITGPADFQGLLLRLPPIPDWVAVWSSLGAVPVLVPLPGIHDALKNGTAQASEGDLTQIQSLKLYEVQSRLTLTSHLVGFGLTAANACFLASVPLRAILKIIRSIEEACDFGTASMKARESSLQAQLQQEGMQIVTPDAAAIRAAARPSVVQLFATKWTVTTWDEVLSF